VILTIDVEADWDSGSKKTESFRHLPDIFEMLEETNSSATLFVVADVAKELKSLGVPKTLEIASHSLSHRFMDRATPEQRRKELVESRTVLDKVFKTEVIGFRAPGFLTYDSMWEDLWKAGYFYSSSLVSGVFPGRYLHFFKGPFFRNHILELPLQHFRLVPVAFGLPYYRLLYPLSKIIHPKNPRIFYMHPTEFMETYPSAEKNRLIRRMYSIRRGEKARRIFKEVFAKFGPTTSIKSYLKTNLRNSGLVK